MTNASLNGEPSMLATAHCLLIDTLAEGEYAEEHIAGAVNIPQKKLTTEGTGHLAKGAPLIVYCYDLD